MSTDNPSPPRIFTHEDPVWRSRSNFIIMAAVDEDKEQLWARQISERTFEICCIPFFVYNLALGDIVETDAGYCVTKVVERSGRFVFRVWMQTEEQSFVSSFVKHLEDFGALVERSSAHMIAIDTANEQMAKDVSGWLSQLEVEGRLHYETGAL